MRKIRNAFAHELSGVSLVSGPHRDRVNELVAPLKQLDEFAKLKGLYEKLEKMEEPRADFRLTVAVIIAQLHKLFTDCRTLKNDTALSLVPYWMEQTGRRNGKLDQA